MDDGCGGDGAFAGSNEQERAEEEEEEGDEEGEFLADVD